MKTRRAQSRHSRDAREYGRTITAVHDIGTDPTPPPALHPHLLFVVLSVTGLGTNEDVLIDLVNMVSNAQMAAIKQKWEAKVRAVVHNTYHIIQYKVDGQMAAILYGKFRLVDFSHLPKTSTINANMVHIFSAPPPPPGIRK